MESYEIDKFKWILILEITLAGAYVSITKGLFVVFLVSEGYGIEAISFVMLISTAVAALLGVLVNRYPSFIASRVKTKLVAFHGLGRLMWFIIPILTDPLSVSVLFSIYMIFSFFVSIFMNFIIYGSLGERDLKDVLAKRSASGGASSIIGFILGVFLLVFLQMEDKFVHIFDLGAAIGLLSTVLIMFLDLSHLEGSPLPTTIEQPEKVLSSSLFFVILMIGGNLLGVVWTPYIMNHLRGQDYLAASLNLVGTVTSIVASLVWGKKSLKTLRISHILYVLSPLITWFTTIPIFHVAVAAYQSFVHTGANFLGNFLFAEYKNWYGAVRSSILLAILGNLSSLLAALLGIVVKENYALAFSAAFALLIISVLLTLVAIPEVAIVSEETARTYSFTLYRNCLNGYKLTMEISKETTLASLKLLTIFSIFILLYIIYRFLTIIMAETIFI